MGRRRKKRSGGGGSSAATAIPLEAMEMVERLKEVVDLPDHEIYAALMECNMDPDDAVNRLMSQDTFIEVKSKCKKKKETKETHESTPEIESSSSSCGFTDDIHDEGPSISMQMNSSDYGVMHGKLVQEKDHGINIISTSSISSCGMAANNSSRRLTPQSESDSINASQSTGPVDDFSFSSRPPLSFQPNWSRAPARPKMDDMVRMGRCQGKASSTPIVATSPVDNFSFFSQPPFGFHPDRPGEPARPTMADVVRMGRRQGKACSTPTVATDGYQSKSCDTVGMNKSRDTSRLCQNTVQAVELNWESHSSHYHASNVPAINCDPGGAVVQQTSLVELSLADQPSVRSDQIVSEIFDASANYADEPAPSSLHAHGADLSFLDDDQVSEGIIAGQNRPTKSTKSASASDRQVDNSGYGFPFPHVYGHHEGAPTRPTMGDIVSMGGHQGKASCTPIVTTGPADSINTSRSTGPVSNFSFSSQAPFSFQPDRSGAPARPTMADVVRMGRRQGKACSTPTVATDGYQSKSCDAVGLNKSQDTSRLCQNTVQAVKLNRESHSSHDHASNVTAINCDPGVAVVQQTSHEELSLADRPSVRSDQIVSEIFDASANYADEPAPSSLHAYGVDLSFLDDAQVSDGIITCQNRPTKSTKSASASDRQVNNSGYGFPHVQGHHEAEDDGMELSLSISNLQQLSLYEEHDTAPAESCPAVKIPEHLQVTKADCSRLSFGAFGSGVTGPSTGIFIPRPLKSNIQVASVTDTSVPPIGQPDTRISKYHHDEQIRPFSDDSVSFITGTSTDNYGMLSTSQPEVTRNDTALHTIQQNFPSASGYAISNNAQPTAAACTYRQANSHMQNLSAFSSAMALNPAVCPTFWRASESMVRRTVPNRMVRNVPNRMVRNVPYHISVNWSPYRTYRHNYNVAPAWSPIPRRGILTQSMPNTNIFPDSFLTQHPTWASYSRRTDPSGRYLPSAAIQQGYSGGNSFQRSPAMLRSAGTRDTIAQARRGISVNNFAPLADVASGHGGSWNSANIPGSYREAPSTVFASRRVGYGGALGSQFRGVNRFLPPHQGENAPTWDHGASRRTATALPGRTSFSFQGRNQHRRVPEGQQPSHFETSACPGNSGSQAGSSNFGVSR